MNLPQHTKPAKPRFSEKGDRKSLINAGLIPKPLVIDEPEPEKLKRKGESFAGVMPSSAKNSRMLKSPSERVLLKPNRGSMDAVLPPSKFSSGLKKDGKAHIKNQMS